VSPQSLHSGPETTASLDYVLMTSAFNEEKYIEKTIQSVISQTVRPTAWVIVSDGSTDQTDTICIQYSRSYDFIHYIRVDHSKNEVLPRLGTVAFRKVNALTRAVGILASIPYAYIGNIDGDVTIDRSCFEDLTRRFGDDPRLGIGGGFIYNVVDGSNVPAFVNPRNVGGALQFFRVACFREIGGYVPGAHEDSIALIAARMKGWTTKSFPDIKVYHHKTTNWVGPRRWKSKYKLGMIDYVMSDSLPWVVLRCLKELRETPPVVGSFARFAGYLVGAMTESKVLTPDAQRYVRNEQYRILINAVSDRLRTRPTMRIHL
jgi:poly-beta-1,6-N-acetyl-D-glucosamine synthase